jgi:hypothetical protein
MVVKPVSIPAAVASKLFKKSLSAEILYPVARE